MLSLANYALKLASKAKYAEVRYEKAQINKFVLKNSILESSESYITEGFCIRILNKGALGCTFTNSLTKTAIKKAVAQAFKLTRISKPLVRQPIELSNEKKSKAKYEVSQRRKLEDVTPDIKISELVSIDKTVLGTGVKIPSRFFILKDELREKLYINSDGTKIQSKIPRILFDYLITVCENSQTIQRSFSFGASSGWEIIAKWKLVQKLESEARKLKKILIEGKKTPNGKLDIILGPELVGIITHESVGHPYEADRILGREAAQAGESFIERKMLGTKIGSEVVSVIDDPRIPGSYGYYLYDDEGVKAQRRYLIKEGLINEFLHNRWSAALFGIKSNGAARANNWNAEPIVRMANTYVAPGDYSNDELIRETKNGIYIKTYMEWNIDDKRFNQRYVGLEAYAIERGELTHFIKKPVLEITTPTFWSSIDAIAKPVEFIAGHCGKGEPMQGIPVWFGGPHIRLKNIMLGD